jgi:hypothetical protein
MSKQQKGGQYERDKSRQTSLWWSNNERDDLIWRSSNSGGRATSRYKKGKTDINNLGDLRLDDPIIKPLFDYIFFELKNGYTESVPSKSINVLYWLDKPKNSRDPLLYSFWKKAEKERKQSNRKETWIIFKRDYKQDCLMMNQLFFTKLFLYNGEYKHDSIWMHYKNDNLVIVKLDDFFNWCPPETIQMIIEKDD